MIPLAVAVAVALLSVLARRIGIASSVLLLGAGTALSFAPGLPRVTLDPNLVLLLLLPPLLYSSGVGMSWRGFRSNLRAILLLAIGCVLFTAAAVAAVAHYALGLPWAVGFVLGAIVSPPDAIAPMAILRKLKLPHRLVTILEGESLVNDATALVLLSFAIGAVATGAFSPAGALGRFGAIVGCELAWGVVVGWGALRLRHVARDPKAEVLLALVTPFVAFWPPHDLGGSGVIACVAAGLWVSWNGRELIRPATRLQGYFIWGLVTWTVEGAVFLLTGLQAQSVLEGVSGRGASVLAAGALISITVIVVRFVWVFPATYLSRLIPAVRRHDRAPNWRTPFMVGFTGLRGVVSLAAALSIPVTIGGAPFPARDFVLFLTFCVIGATLVGQGAMLPWVARRLNLVRAGEEEHRENKRGERAVRIEGIDAALAEVARAEAAGAPPGAAAVLRRRHSDRRAELARTADEAIDEDPVADTAALQLRLIDAERAAAGQAYAAHRITDDARRRIERELDLEEARVRHAADSAGSLLDPADNSAD